MLLILQSPAEPADYLKLFRSQKVDACVILGSRDVPGERDSLRQLAEHALPFCLVNQSYEGESFSEVDADHVSGSFLAVRHLIESGCSNIAFLNGSPQYSNSGARLEGYRRALSQSELLYREEWVIQGNYSRKKAATNPSRPLRHTGRSCTLSLRRTTGWRSG